MKDYQHLVNKGQAPIFGGVKYRKPTSYDSRMMSIAPKKRTKTGLIAGLAVVVVVAIFAAILGALSPSF